MNDATDINTVRSKINQISYRGTSQADITSALNSAANVVFTNAGGYRANQRNVVVVVSTKSSESIYFNEVANSLKQKADGIFGKQAPATFVRVIFSGSRRALCKPCILS